MKPKKTKSVKHSETWWAVFNSVRFAIIKGDHCYAGLEGLIIAKTKKELDEFDCSKQRIVKIKITEI